MAAQKLANEDLTLGHDVDAATLNITTAPSAKVKANSKGVYNGPIIVAVSAASKGACLGASGVVVINPTATKVKADNLGVLRETDQGVGTVNGLQGGSPCSFPITVKVDLAGQDKVKGE